MAQQRGGRAKDLRDLFPLRHERQVAPRLDGHYAGADGERVEFAADGTLRWNGEPGSWRVHGETLYVTTATRDCEGAIGFSDIYLICADGKALDGRTQLVLTLVTAGA